MVLKVQLPEGAFLADAGFGNLAPTGALKLVPIEEQDTPHEVMRFVAMGEELTLQAKLGHRWEHIYRVSCRFRASMRSTKSATGTPGPILKVPIVNNMIAARPGPGRTRLTLFNARFTIRHASGAVERRMLSGERDYAEVLERHSRDRAFGRGAENGYRSRRAARHEGAASSLLRLNVREPCRALASASPPCKSVLQLDFRLQSSHFRLRRRCVACPQRNHGHHPRQAPPAPGEGPQARHAGAAQAGLDPGEGAGVLAAVRRDARDPARARPRTRCARRPAAPISPSAGRAGTPP